MINLTDTPVECCICDKPMRHPTVREYGCRCGACNESVRTMFRRGRFRGTPKQRRLRATRETRRLHRHICENCGERLIRCRCCPF